MSSRLLETSPLSDPILSPRFHTMRVQLIDHPPPDVRRMSFFPGYSLYVFRGHHRGQQWEFKKTFKQLEQGLKKVSLFVKQEGLSFSQEYPTFKEWQLKSAAHNFAPIKEAYETYINTLLENERVRNSEPMVELIEHAPITSSFEAQIFKQGWIKKRSGGRFKHEKKCFFCYCRKCCRKWVKKWMVVTSDFICYYRSTDSKDINEIMLFDANFRVVKGLSATRKLNGLIIRNGNRSLHVQAENSMQMDLWYTAINDAFTNSDFNPGNNRNSFSSFAPARGSNYCKWFICGEDYYDAVYNQLNAAKYEIYITDWWLTPTLYLKRPVDLKNEQQYNYSRIDHILKDKVGAKADKGVKIYILLYKEIEMVLPMKSAYTKRHLVSLSPQIQVVRHPKTLLSFWSHHQKIIVIDQKLAFVGGIDLCFGRFCNREHPLTDLAPQSENQACMFPGLDYSNVRVKDYTDVDQYQKDIINRQEVPRMPWQDIAVMVAGQAAKDLAHHFIQYWNHAKTESTGTKAKNFVVLRPDSHQENLFSDEEMMDESVDGQDIRLSPIPEEHNDGPSLQNGEHMILEINDGQDRMRRNTYHVRANQRKDQWINRRTSVKKSNYNRGNSENNNIMRRMSSITNRPNGEVRVPKNTDHIEVRGIPLIGGTASRSFKQVEEETHNQLEHLKSSKAEKFKNIMKRIFGLSVKSEEERAKEIFTENYKKKIEKENYDEGPERVCDSGPLFAVGRRNQDQEMGSCICQILRSASLWSTGLAKGTEERSIYEAYITLIAYSEHFIYIENQFFISNAGGLTNEDSTVENRIAEALVLRIKKAHESKEKFRVIIVLPLLPGFEGQVQAATSAVLRAQMHYQYVTISRGGNSILQRLEKMGIPHQNYISFFGLRNHAVLCGKPVTEIVYVHSKVMIVDDRYVLLGSANINDRSQLGVRDSEIDVLIEDTCTFPLKLNHGKIKYDANLFAHSLRTNILASHLGCETNKVDDMLSDRFWEELLDQAKVNTEIYRRLFQCYPDDEMKTFRDIDDNKLLAPEEGDLVKEYEDLKEKIEGFIVEWPLHFLEEENLKIKFLNKEYYLPEINFT